jgi:hypothetical protein
MSKASNFVKLLKTRPIFPEGAKTDPNMYIRAHVTDSGSLHIDAGAFEPEHAIELAKWILQTFEDQEKV